MWDTVSDAVGKETILEKERKAIKEMTPKPMNTMLTKQPKEEAIKKHQKRKAMVAKDVPPTSGTVTNQATYYNTLF